MAFDFLENCALRGCVPFLAMTIDTLGTEGVSGGATHSKSGKPDLVRFPSAPCTSFSPRKPLAREKPATTRTREELIMKEQCVTLDIELRTVFRHLRECYRHSVGYVLTGTGYVIPHGFLDLRGHITA